MSHTLSNAKSNYVKRPLTYKRSAANYKRRQVAYKRAPSSYSSSVKINKNQRVYKKKMALLLPAHNEELIIQATIKSAIAAGQNKEDIYVVNDASTDKTRVKAIELLDKKQVLTVRRSGKARAVYQAIKHFEIENRYAWVHVADADSVFGNDYFRIYRRGLKGKKYTAAVGFVQRLLQTNQPLAQGLFPRCPQV
jgi:cellulose synthase/poly-beta-1,6-N-acetylglucosamine synthase-like glycosyltransferase